MLFHRTLPIALLALLVWCAQATGLRRGFLCDCGGVVRITLSDHCHGPHDQACEEANHEGGDHDRHDHDEEEPVHEHPVLMETIEAEKTPSAAFEPPFLVGQGIWLTPQNATWRVDSLSRAGPFQPPRERWESASTWCERWVETIALRI